MVLRLNLGKMETQSFSKVESAVIWTTARRKRKRQGMANDLPQSGLSWSQRRARARGGGTVISFPQPSVWGHWEQVVADNRQGAMVIPPTLSDPREPLDPNSHPVYLFPGQGWQSSANLCIRESIERTFPTLTEPTHWETQQAEGTWTWPVPRVGIVLVRHWYVAARRDAVAFGSDSGAG